MYNILIAAAVAAALTLTACSTDSSPLSTSSEPQALADGWIQASSKPDTSKRNPPAGESISLNFEEIKTQLDGLIDDITPPPGEPVGLLLPAIQKVRDAAARAQAAAEARTEFTPAVNALKAVVALMEEEAEDRGDDMSLEDIIAGGGPGAGGHIKEAKLTCRKAGGDGHAAPAELSLEILFGYAVNGLWVIAQEENRADLPMIREVLDRCMIAADGIKKGYDVKKNVKV